MEQFMNELLKELLSQPLFLIMVIIGVLGLIYSVIKNTRYYVVHIGLFIMILALSGAFGKTGQSISFVLALILIVIGVIWFVALEYKSRKNNSNTVNDTVSIADNICPKCGGMLKEREGKYGKFYGCSIYPECKFIRKIDENNNITVNVNITGDKDVENITISNNICPKCGGTLKEREGKYGKFYGCSNYPRCKYTKKGV